MEATMKTYPFQKVIPALLFLLMAFLAGRGLADYVEEYDERTRAQSSSGAVLDEGGMTGREAWPFALNSPMLPGTENWGLGFGTQGAKPAGNATTEEMKEYNAYYVAPGEEKTIYLTFDCGYENGNTEAILDALKKHRAPATFFVVGHYLESAPELVKRMVAEGHAVGDHTYHHPDMSKISDLATFQKEMDDVRTKFFEVTGQEMPAYYRPPQGKYNTENLQMAKELGYATFFWSLAYVDWNVNDQPTREEAFSKLTTRIHPGAIVLLHNTSKTNAEILDDLLAKWEEMGYSFAPLSELLQ
ncbi:MAG: polysaccharide deacetylase family protein [Acetatifactor sp.]|nr:polysaccharide deacetylase family protein [Acetatifactor sp.]